MLALAAVCGLYLIRVGGWPILAVGLLSMLAAVAYTYGPTAVRLLSAWATWRRSSSLASSQWWEPTTPGGRNRIAHGAFVRLDRRRSRWARSVTAILVVNNVRDADTDRAAGKRTLAVMLGRRGARIEYVIMLALAYAVPFVLWLGFGMSPWVLLPLLTLPLAVRHARAVWTVLGPRLNKTLGGTAQLAVLVCAGVCVRHHRRPVPCRHMRVALARARNGARSIAGSRRLPEVRRPLALVAPRLRNCLTVFSPLLFAWLAALAIMPVTQWSAGHLGLLAGVYLGVLLQSSLVVVYLAQAAGIRRAAVTALALALAAFAFEVAGSKTGVPFGSYHYTDALQPQLFGVPLLIPLAWLMMLPPAWAVAQRVTGRRSGMAFVAVSALALTAWDLFLDPQMVHWGLWVWHAPGAYFGIPLTNFAGWLLVAGLITVLVRPPALPAKPLLVIYSLTWLLESVGQVVFWRLRGPVPWGFIAMGLFVWLAWRQQSLASHLPDATPDPVSVTP